MTSAALAPIFFLYAGAAYYALWVVGDQNGVATGAIGMCASGAVRSVYTGFAEVDKIVGLLVAFFEAASSLPQGPPFQSAFASLFAIPLVIIQLESSRRNNPILIRWSALITGAAAQLVGAALALPIWMALYSLTATPGAVTGSNTRIRTIAPAFTLAFFGLALLMTNEGGYLTKDGSFIGSAFWQAFPLWTSLLQLVLPAFLTSNGTTANTEARKTMSFFLILTTAVYWKSLYAVHALAKSTGTSYSDVLRSIVNISLHPKTLAESCHLFLLFDAATIFAATFTFVVFSGGAKALSTSKLALGVATLAPMIGPGAALMWGWRARDSGGIALKGKKRS